MSVALKYDPESFQRILGMIGAVKKKSVKDTLFWAAGLYARNLAGMTPPMGKNPIKEFTNNSTKQKEFGEGAVEKTIRSIFVPLNSLAVMRSGIGARELRLAERVGGENFNVTFKLRKYVREGNLRAVSRILRDVGVPNTDVLRDASRLAHKYSLIDEKRRKKRGVRYYVVNAKSIDMLVKETQKRVGGAKRGWLESFRRLKRRMPGWITRTKTGAGYFTDHSEKDRESYIEMINNNPGARPTNEGSPIELAAKGSLQQQMREHLAKILDYQMRKSR